MTPVGCWLAIAFKAGFQFQEDTRGAKNQESWEKPQKPRKTTYINKTRRTSRDFLFSLRPSRLKGAVWADEMAEAEPGAVYGRFGTGVDADICGGEGGLVDRIERRVRFGRSADGEMW